VNAVGLTAAPIGESVTIQHDMTDPTNHIDAFHTRPKLVFFQYEYDERLPAFLLMHKREHVKCLSQFFEVTVIHEDCDYQQVCDKYEPDLTLFESGVPNPACRRLEIANIRACPQIPKLGFLHADGFCSARAGFLSDMDHWGIKTFFAIATTAAEHMPAIADNLFIWPNFVDPEIYRDYDQWKSIPVLFTGNSNSLYPWRQKVIRLVSKRYPSLICPHPGYAAPRSLIRTASGIRTVAEVAVGEPYARMLNAAWFVPACGAVAKEVVRKHFEIPACRACLIAEKSPALEAAGFVDMTNCVFADDRNILDKLGYLFNNLDALNEIINAGHQLVHSRHTLHHRDQILQWFNLHKSLKPNQKIIQTGPFEPLRIVEKSLPAGNSHITCDGLHLRLLREGDKELRAGNYREAERLYLRCASHISYMPEPKVRLALCNLYKGNPKKALSYILEPIQFTLAEYKAIDPDPVEWAYFIVSLLCLGKIDDAVMRASEFAWLHHPELDRVRWVTDFLRKNGGSVPRIDNNIVNQRFTIHQLPSRSLGEWIEQLCIMLRACGQDERARALTACCSQGALSFQERHSGPRADRESSATKEEEIHKKLPGKTSLAFGRKDALGFFNRQLLYTQTRSSLKRILRDALHRLEAKYQYFLPYHLSEGRNDEFFHAIQDLAQEEDIKSALVIGAASGQGGTEALLMGALENKNKPSVFCLSGRRHRSISLPRSAADLSIAKWYRLSSSSPESLLQELEKNINKIKEENHIDFFDMVLIDGSELEHQITVSDAVNKELYAASFVLLDDISTVSNYDYHNELLRDSRFALVAHNPGLRNGYSIFRRKNSADSEGGNALCSPSIVAE